MCIMGTLKAEDTPALTYSTLMVIVTFIGAYCVRMYLNIHYRMNVM